ncbi:MAG: PSD1 and planctomycete cytochrome C domain-containing protein [Planctomycetia bacterium]
MVWQERTDGPVVRRLAAALLGGLGCLFVATVGRADERTEFFEKSVRPVLLARCAGCHGAEKRWADLRLDTRAGLMAGGDHGAVVVAGEPDASRLVAAVRRLGDLQMPPDDPLPDGEVEALVRWVRAGAVWPDDPPSRADPAAAARHWAFRPPVAVEPPEISAETWAVTPIDRFIHRGLEEAGLAPSREADRRTLVRRLSYDLTGLPPTPEEVAAFERDPGADAYDRLVDRLLASPRYGEQQARRWLDVARYADTKGYVYGREERAWVHAATYRDWVVRAVNDGMPYDRFLLLQIAADQEAADDPAAAAAMGFLTLGRRFLGVTHDIIDDRIDVVTRTTMGLTVACARCHDHKYDPIPTADYYALYGVFLNAVEELVPTGARSATGSAEAVEAYEKGLAERVTKLEETTATRRSEAAARVRSRIGEYLVAQTELERYPAEGFDQILGDGDVIPTFVRRFSEFLSLAARDTDPVFAPWAALARLPAEGFESAAAATIARLGEAVAVNPRVALALEPPPRSMRETAERYAGVFAEAERLWQAAIAAAKEAGMPPPTGLPDPSAEELRRLLDDAGSPCLVPDEPIVSTEGFFSTKVCEELWKLQGEVDRWLIQQPLSPPHALRLVDRPVLRPAHVLRRGDPKQKGPEVPRRFLSVIAGAEPAPFAHGSGRRELARAIVDPGNPLTARVWVNRLWQQHFGRGLVDTPSDFGLRSNPPSHPELLDWLARELVGSGWSTRHVERLIVRSAVYRQRSDTAGNAAVAERASRVDPENRLLWRMPVRRLSFEEYRDTLLATSGRLDATIGGRASDLFAGGGINNRRRSLYGLVDRQFLPAVLRAFDFANPDLHVPRRNETTVPQQALFALNHPLVAAHAKELAKRARAAGGPTESVRDLYRAVYQREPTAAQEARALAFLAGTAEEPEAPLRPESRAWQYGYGAIDEDAGTLRSFNPLPHFTGTAWQGAEQWPGGGLGWAQLTATGGHTGDDLAHSVVRRWTAPHAGRFAVTSTAAHETAAGDGVRCHVVSSRGGRLAKEAIHNRRVSFDLGPLALEAGDTLDFVVDVGATLNHDEHLWAPVIRALEPLPDRPREWDAARDFAGPPPERLSRLEQLAHVLVMANETFFVD